MDIFEYKGRNQRGEIMQGVIESSTPQAVAKWMMDIGISPIQIQVQGNKLKGQPEWLRELQGGGSPKLVDLLLFTRQMGTMVKAGVPIMQALAGIQKSTANPMLVEVLRDIRANLDKGLELSRAMSRHPKVFDDYYVSMVKVGEDSGQLEEVFKRLHEQLGFDKNIAQKVKGALRYPVFVIIAISIAIAIMTLFVIPVFAKTYAKFHATLPLLTLAMLAISDFAVHYWWAVLAMIGIAFYAFKLYIDQPKGRYAWDKFKLRLPIVGSILQKSTLARFCRSFATASRSGVPLVQAFTLVSRVVSNAYFEERILLMRDGVERGESMLRVAQTAAIFNQLELQMIAVGEETGDIEGMLNQVADLYTEEVEFEVGRMSQTIEPILLACMGALVLLLMLGVFLPMWDLGTVAMKKH
jgi:MSHA biogenesis protein MshG